MGASESTLTAAPDVELRQMCRELSAAGDAQLVRVVAMIDRLADRGAADAVLAPLRPRLRQLRPQRPLSLTRLLFLPLDPVIVPATEWRRGALAIPRTALSPLSRSVRERLGAAAAPLDAELRQLDTANRDGRARLGEALWPLAAAVLAQAPVPDGWEAATGLVAADHAAIARAAAVALRQAVPIQRLVDRAATGTEIGVEDVRPILAAITADALDLAGLAVALLLARLPSPTPVLLAASRISERGAAPELYIAADRAIESTVDRLRSDVIAAAAGAGAGDDLAEASARIGGAVERLGGLRNEVLRPERAAQIDQVRRELDATCRRQFVSCLAEQVLAPIRAASGGLDVSVLEATVRGLRHLQGAGRRLGGGEAYDAALRDAAARLTDGAEAAGGPLKLVDRVRLTELLVGPEAALALLDQPAAAASSPDR